MRDLSEQCNMTSWFKKNALYVLPERVELTTTKSELTDEDIKSILTNTACYIYHST